MKLKEVSAKVVKDSRGEKTILVIVDNQLTSAPSGKSTGKYEEKAYRASVEHDVSFINNMKFSREINKFEDLEFLEKYVTKQIGANTLFALEASVLKALAKSQGKELWELLNPKINAKKAKFPRVLSNTIGGGAHSNNDKHPDFQEFLVTSNNNPAKAKETNESAYCQAQTLLKNLESSQVEKNDENALQTSLENSQVLEVMKELQEDMHEEKAIHIDIGLDIAASQFFSNGRYNYKNPKKSLTTQEQINYIAELIEKYGLFYVEDALDEEDFDGFAELLKKTRGECLICGDDLTTTNPERLKLAIKKKAINAIIVKPNQIGSLLKVKEVIELAKKNNIFVIVSHRSGETRDNTISDLAFAWGADFIKTPVIGPERLAKVDRLIEIEKSLGR